MANPPARPRFLPGYAIPPGATLRDLLDQAGITQADLAARSGLSTKHVNQILQGVAPISYQTASILERITGLKAAYWNALEANYRGALLRASRKISSDDKQWLRQLPIKALQQRGLLPSDTSPSDQFDGALSFFGVADRTAWERVWMRPAAAFRRSHAFSSDPGAVATWLRLGELEARKVEATAPFDAIKFRRALQDIRGLTRDLDSDRLVDICSQVGVAVVFVKEMGGCRISGAAWWATPTRGVIAVSDRYKADDFFWFTFFHEASHLLLHSKKETFVDDGSDHTEIEDEANRFASELLIPPRFAHQLKSIRTVSEVLEFAEELGIAPGIVVGRLHHERLWDWSKGNRLRRHVYIVDD